MQRLKNYDYCFYAYTDGTFLINVNTNEPIVTAVECFLSNDRYNLNEALEVIKVNDLFINKEDLLKRNAISEGLIKVTLYMEPEKFKEYMVNCFVMNKNNNDYIEEVLRKYLPGACFVNNKDKNNIDLG